MTNWQPSARVTRWQDLAERWSRQTGCPAALILAIIQQESGGDPAATRYEPKYEKTYLTRCKEISRATGHSTDKVATSYGLMQLMMPTAWGYLSAIDKGSGVITALFDPEKNIRYGAAHLGTILRKHTRGGVIDAAVIRAAAREYNGGGSDGDSNYARSVCALWRKYETWLKEEITA